MSHIPEAKIVCTNYKKLLEVGVFMNMVFFKTPYTTEQTGLHLDTSASRYVWHAHVSLNRNLP